MKTRFYIKDNGFKGIYTAFWLRNRGYEVTINPKNFGGIYNGIAHSKYNFDIGCHLFDSNDSRFYKEIHIDKKETIAVDLKYFTADDYKISENYAIPDLRGTIIGRQITTDILNDQIDKKLPESGISLWERNKILLGIHGAMFAEKISFKICGISSKFIDARSFEPFFFSRVLSLDNEEALAKKKCGFDIFAAQSKSVHDYNDGHIVFTFKNGTKGFVSHSKRQLEEIGVLFSSDEKIINNSHQISFHDNDFEKSLRIPIPLHLIYFETNSSDFTYLHDYSSNFIFRISAPGFYSEQVSRLKSYICVEIPDSLELLNYSNARSISEKYIKEIGIEGDFLHYVKFGNSYPIFRVSDRSEFEFRPFEYSKTSIMNMIDSRIEKVLEKYG